MSSRSSFVSILLAMVVSLALVTHSSEAHAQEGGATFAYLGFYGAISSYTGLTTTVAGGVTLTVMLLVKSSADIENYVDQNAVALQHDLYMGGGESLGDLATIFNVPDEAHGRFASALYHERDTLSALMNTADFDRPRAGQFLAVVLDAMQKDAVLAASMPHFEG
ncbi:DUF3015 domain-containing protein [Lujinxingia vulgaris]|uniref:DUF3015 domain-containing protein n=1 Tax=Lujinxingia vulgaris TaxID=2600176 RepID=A0A5C6XR73_9DELT|nr:DUF3015 family protein [Lujinxingia vulgaris]TXD41625.1 DUF3015 domain-containing protein [Lujinxingia vulgaris]